jgi:hypothetical protein
MATNVQADPPESIEATRPAPATSPEKAFALILETACEDFENLQDLIRGRLKVLATSEDQNPAVSFEKGRERVRRIRAPTCINMALAKSFVFNARRANRICTHNKAALPLDRLDRTRFLKATEPLIAVRDVNEHAFDSNRKITPQMHHHEGVLIDETSMVVTGPEKILMGPLNLYDVYLAVDRVRKLAGFAALTERRRQAILEEKRAAAEKLLSAETAPEMAADASAPSQTLG